MRNGKMSDYYDEQEKKTGASSFTIGAVAVGILFVVAFILGLYGSAHIKTGYVGIVKHPNGEVTKINQGWHWIGFTSSAQEYPTFTQSLILSDKDYEGKPINQQWEVGTADQQSLPVNTSLTWKINPDDATAVYQSIGGQDITYVDDKIVEPTLKSIVNEITHKYSYADIRGAKQADITTEINAKLNTALAKDGIILERFGFTYVGLPKGMEQAQAQLASAELGKQQAQAAQDRAKIENDTKIMNATADANAAKIEAEGTKAKAAAVTALTVQEEAIQKWNGQLPVTEAGGALPFLNIGGK